MKGLRVCLLSIIIILTFSTIALANSGPVFWQGYPSWETMSIDENSPIVVNNEELVFDFSEGDHLDYRISGDVTATYQMKNPTDKELTVQMGFPFVGSLLSKEDNIQIKVDNEEIPHELYIGDDINDHDQGTNYREENPKNYDFEGIINSISKEPYEAETFKENERGKLYTIDVNPPADQEIKLAISFSYEAEQTKILANDFNSVERDGEKMRVGVWCNKPTTLEIYVLGEDIDFDIGAYTDGELQNEVDFTDYSIATEEVEFRTYLFDFLRKIANPEFNETISEVQLYNFYAKELDIAFQRNGGFASAGDLLANNYEGIFVIAYSVDFPPNSEKEVKVNYKTTATMDRSKTTDPLYIVDYILNPAQYWDNFQDLNIKVIPSEELPYIVSSNMDFQREDNLYKASFENLPKEDLTFTLYNKEKITFIDKTLGNLNRHFGYFTPIVVGIIVLIIILIMVILIKRKKRYNL